MILNSTALFCVVLHILSSAVHAETITWMVSDNSSLPEARANTARTSLHYLIDHMPQFQHRLLVGDMARADYELAHEDGVCKPGLMKTPERAVFALFNKRVVPFPGFHLAVRKGERARFKPFMDEAGKLDLARLARSEILVGGYVTSTPHIGTVQHFIEDPERRVRLEKSPGSKQLLGALQGGRIDFTIVLPIEADIFAAAAGHPGEFALLPIKAVPSYLETFIACSNGPLGKQAIDAIDGVLQTDANWQSFLAPLKPWLDPSDYAQIVTSKVRQE
jgi:uncharacterized protein (TIGR02285 family)